MLTQTQFPLSELTNKDKGNTSNFMIVFLTVLLVAGSFSAIDYFKEKNRIKSQ